jgi:quinol-cytochrome oxidoreductase complex cytochrome b subunit
LFSRHDIALFPVARTFVGHSVAFTALVFWIIQLITGFFLLGLVAYSLDLQYLELISISFHGNLVWLLRLMHMLLANFVVVATILHFSKVIAYSQVISSTKFLIWLVGSGIFLLSLAVAFTGYVVVSGNMSYWAALVILNLASVVPFLGDEVVAWVLASATVTSWSIRRFTVLHFLLAVVAIALIGIHVILLHRQAPSKNSGDIADNSETLALILVKDLAITFLILSFVFADSVKSLVHPDNWGGFSRLVTPTHIEPEIYFLWTFSAIKLHNGKLSGALLRDIMEPFLYLDLWCRQFSLFNF